MKEVAIYEDESSDLEEIKVNHFLLHTAIWRLYACPICRNVILEFTGKEIFDEDIVQVLYPGITNGNSEIPKEIKNAYEAAIKIKHIDGAICALALRRTLEMVCKDKGEIKGDLYNKIKNLSKKGILPPILDQMATVLRHIGNAAAHGDDTKFDHNIVHSMIEFTNTILEYVYVLPKKLSIIQENLSKEERKIDNENIEETA
jgi:hypothetical protein